MATPAAERLKWLANTIPGKLMAIPTNEFDRKPAPGKWSKKEIIGHLIDSAANNHQRFIRAQYQDKPVIFYDQEKWVALNHYESLERDHVITLWQLYNLHLAEIMSRVPGSMLLRECIDGEGRHATLGWLMDDYVTHAEHHLKQVTEI